VTEVKRIFNCNTLGSPQLLKPAQFGFLLDRDDVFVEIKVFGVKSKQLVPQLSDRGCVLSVIRPYLALWNSHLSQMVPYIINLLIQSYEVFHVIKEPGVPALNQQLRLSISLVKLINLVLVLVLLKYLDSIPLAKLE